MMREKEREAETARKEEGSEKRPRDNCNGKQVNQSFVNDM